MRNENGNGKIWRLIAGALFGVLQLVTIFMLNQMDARFLKLEDRQNAIIQRLVRVETLLTPQQRTEEADP